MEQSFKKVPDYADVMSLACWEEMVMCAVFTPDDGNGYWCAGETRQSDVNCFSKKPEWATHVAWYNR